MRIWFIPRWVGRNGWKLCLIYIVLSTFRAHAAGDKLSGLLHGRTVIFWTLGADPPAFKAALPSRKSSRILPYWLVPLNLIICSMNSLLSGWRIWSQALNGNFVCFHDYSQFTGSDFLHTLASLYFFHFSSKNVPFIFINSCSSVFFRSWVDVCPIFLPIGTLQPLLLPTVSSCLRISMRVGR